MIWLKRGFALATLGMALYLFWPLVGEFRATAGLFKQAHWGWLFLAIGFQFVSYASLTWLNALALRPFSGNISTWRLAALLTSMAFIEVAIPSGGASGLALRARLLKKHGSFTIEASMFSLIVETLFEGVAVVSIGLIGLVYLLTMGDLSATSLSYLYVISLGMFGLIWGGWRFLQDPAHLRPLVHYLGNIWNRFAGKKRLLDEVLVDARLENFNGSLGRFRKAPHWKLWLAAYGKVFLDVATLGVCFLVFNQPIPYDVLIVGYGIMLLMSGLASLPGGLGVADVSLPVVYARLGVPGAVALAAGLTYRLIAFWAVRFIGFVSWQYLEEKR